MERPSESPTASPRPTDGGEVTEPEPVAPAGDAQTPVSPRRRWLELGAFVLLLAGALVGAAYLGGARDGARSGEAAVFDVVRAKVPEAAPDFELADLAGRPVRLADFRGRVVFLNFWATWCGPCREEFPAMAALARELGDQGLVILAVNFQEDPEPVAAFAREFQVPFAVLLDPSGEVGQRYRVQALPTTVLVDRQGMLAGVALGYRAWHTRSARGYLRELLAARPGGAAG